MLRFAGEASNRFHGLRVCNAPARLPQTALLDVQFSKCDSVHSSVKCKAVLPVGNGNIFGIDCKRLLPRGVANGDVFWRLFHARMCKAVSAMVG
jgi:hypothetical protein